MHQLINDGWLFAKAPFGSKYEERNSFVWKKVDLPHDWLIWQTNDLYETADAWYTRTIPFDGEDGLRRRIRFDGVYMDCDVILNGEVICSHAYGYTAFDADLTGKLKQGDNELTVHIRHQSPNTRWYSGSGIYRDVELITEPLCRFIPDSFYVITEKDGEGWNLKVSAETEGTGENNDFTVCLKDDKGQALETGIGTVKEGKAFVQIRTDKVKEWSLEERNLYDLTCRTGEHEETIRIGFRTIELTTDRGFFLNGKHVKLKGVCLHHDLGCLGAAFHKKAAARQLRVMKEMGVNALRTSHNPPARQMLDLCDEMGILVIDEAFDMWERSKTTYDYARFFPEHEAEDVASWVRRDRTHASVIMWSIGNEIFDMHADDRGREVTRILMEQVRSHDPEAHGVVTFGSNYMPWEGAQLAADIVKVPGYNYAERYYAEHHEKHPDWVIYGSETASVLASRDIYHFPAENPILCEEDLQCSDLGNSTSSWGAPDMRHCIVDDLNTPYSMGQFIWSGIDYIGEPTPYKTRSCYFGQADTACFPKEVYYLFKSIWNEEKMLHIGIQWDFNPSQLIDVRVMTNAAAAELFLNGESLGKKNVDIHDAEQCCPTWQVPYAAGELKAIGYDEDGRKILEDVRRTPGDPVRIRLEAEDPALQGDGQDMTFITVTVEDAQGRTVENATNRVHISVSGAGCLLGTDNGDSTDLDPYKCNDRRLFSGKLLVVAGALNTDGEMRVRVTGEGLEEAELVIPVIGSCAVSGTSREERIEEKESCHDLPLRKIEILAPDGNHMGPDCKELTFLFKTLPENADTQQIRWQVTTRNGIVSPCAVIETEGNKVIVKARGDGDLYLRASCNNGYEHARIISQKELIISGLGMPYMDPYEEISAGLHTFSHGDIGAGNDKGIAFSRFDESTVGFENIDFGPVGSDTIHLPIFALDGSEYHIEVHLGDLKQGAELLTVLKYQKPSIWNTYQEEVYTLPRKLTGIRSLGFTMREKVHLRGFRFDRQSRAFTQLTAGEADEVYGDSFVRDGDAVKEIGNNVSLVFKNMDFGDRETAVLVLDGQTPLAENAVTMRMKNEAGETVTELAPFKGHERGEQKFRIRVTKGMSEVAFVFLPGCQFDFYGLRFED